MNKILKSTIIISIIRIFDVITTYFAIKKFGVEVEANILIRFQIELLNNLVLGLIVYYLWTTVFLYFTFMLINYLSKKKNKPKLFKIAFWTFVVIFSLIPIWNLLNIILL